MEKTGNGGSIVAAIHDDGTPPRALCPILVKLDQYHFHFLPPDFQSTNLIAKLLPLDSKLTSSKFGFVFLLEFSSLEKLNPKQFEIIPIRLIPAFHSHICQGYCSFSSTF